MSERTITITVTEGKYQVENSGISEFELIGILECLVFEMKSSRQTAESAIPPEKQIQTVMLAPKEPTPIEVVSEQPIVSVVAEPSREVTPTEDTEQKDSVSEKTKALRTRISNALKAIRDLGGETVNIELDMLTDEELQTELDDLTEQYKRLKKSKWK